MEFIVIDDCSDPVLTVDRGDLNLRFFKIIDDIPWNMPGCKNLAGIQARSDWLLFFDIDQKIEETGFQKILNSLNLLDKKTLYRFSLIWNDVVHSEPHVNTLLMSRVGFLQAGMIDEDFSGHYGYEDVHFNMVWTNKIGPSVWLKDVYFVMDEKTKTSTLNRDTSRNQTLGSQKIYIDNYGSSVGRIRFKWIEIEK